MKTASEPEQIGVVVVIEVTSGTILTSTVAELVNGTLQLVNDTLLKAITTFEVGAVIVTVACPEVGMVTVWFEPLLIVYVTTDPAVPLIVNTASETELDILINSIDREKYYSYVCSAKTYENL